jgi:LacI family transcriptional regulator
MAAMEELEFIPNVVARGLSSGKHSILGLVFTRAVVEKSPQSVNDSVLVVEEASLLYTDIVIRGAEMRAAELGYSLLLSSADERHPSSMSALLNLSGTVDGLILLDRVVRDDDVPDLAKRIPLVLLAGRGNSASAITVRVDNELAMRNLAEHFIQVHGFTRLGFVAGSSDSPDSVARARAFQIAVDELGGTIDDVNYLEADWTSSGGEIAMKNRLTRDEPLPQAIACANDQTAVGVIYALSDSGLRVPDDVAVTGFDDISLTRYFRPPLTTFRQSGSILGQVAVDALVSMINEPGNTAREIVLPTELVVRASCGCDEGADSTEAMGKLVSLSNEGR